MVVHLVSPDNSRDALYLRNYGQLNVRDELLRIPGMGSVIMFGAGDYAMRIWLDPAKLAARSITTGEVDRRDPRAERAGRRRHRRRVAVAQGHRVPARRQHAGPAHQRRGVRRHHRPHRSRDRRADPRPRPRPGRALVGHLLAAQPAQQQGSGGDRDLPGAGLERARALEQRARQDGAAQARLPAGHGLQHRLRPDALRADVDREGDRDAVRGGRAGRAGRHHLPADLARLDHPAARRAGVDRRHVRLPAPARLLDQHADAVRPGAGDRHRRRRRDRRGRERRAQHRGGPERARRDRQGDAGGLGADRRDRAGALRGVRSARLRARPDGPVLQAVRGDDRDQHGDLGVQLADALAGAERAAAAPARRAQGLADARAWTASSAASSAGSTAGSARRSEGYGRGVTRHPASASRSRWSSTRCCSR